jgi:uncharacterized phosphosugar-binding protein
MTNTADAYLEALTGRLSAIRKTLAPEIARAEEMILAVAKNDGRVFIFGTGHSHMLAEEVHYRAGGLAVTVPILAPPLMLHEGAAESTVHERTPGYVRTIFDRYDIRPGDVLIIASNSGVNAATIEAADIGRGRGAKIIALTSVAYSAEVAAARGGIRRLADLADIVLDNGAPAGDAVVEVKGSPLKVGPVSTAIGAAILNAIFAGVAARLATGGNAPIYISANMPGAAEVNKALVERYRPRNPHL